MINARAETLQDKPMFRDLEEKQDVFVGLAAHRTFGANLAWKGNTTSAQGALASLTSLR